MMMGRPGVTVHSSSIVLVADSETVTAIEPRLRVTGTVSDSVSESGTRTVTVTPEPGPAVRRRIIDSESQ